MKIPKTLLLIFAAFLAFGAITPPRASAQVNVSFFYNTLSPYGEWIQTASYGYCWHPTNVDANWAPYTDGYWAYTDGGWTWVSYEDYGGVVYHYGRWANLAGEGWVWVPGETWAPAWVSWRSSPDYVGWAPLPPEAVFRAGFGFGGGVDARFDIGPGSFNFVSVGDFGAPALGAVIVNRQQNINIVNTTTNITNITTNNTTVYTGGPSYAAIAARSTRPIPTLKLVRESGPAAITAAGGKALSRQQGNQLFVLAPKVTAPAGGKLPPPPKVAKTLTDAKVDHGWNMVSDPQQRATMQAKVKTEAGSAAGAKPIKPADIKLVNDKIKAPITPKPLATGAATPGAGKGKKKLTDTTALENAPATEAPGAIAGVTPKPGKLGKAKKPPILDENGLPSTTPAPKLKKSKIAKTPIPGDDTGIPKHGNLQPFANGDAPVPKPKKSTESSDEFGNPKGPANAGLPGEPGQPGKIIKKKKPLPGATPFE